jgi:hypothetical protein
MRMGRYDATLTMDWKILWLLPLNSWNVVLVGSSGFGGSASSMFSMSQMPFLSGF